MTIIYCYDAYCGWSYGFSQVIKQIAVTYKNKYHLEVLSGGMILPENPVHISASAEYIREAYISVERRSGIKFGEDYLWHIYNAAESDWFPDSEKPSIALTIFKEFYPENQVAFATALQFALHYEGRDLCDDEAYRHLLMAYNIPAVAFYNKLYDPAYKQITTEEFLLVKQLQVTGYPTLLMQVSEERFYLLSRGYADFETIQERIKQIALKS